MTPEHEGPLSSASKSKPRRSEGVLLRRFLLPPHPLAVTVSCVFWVRNSGAVNIHVSTRRRGGWARCARTTNQTQRAG